MAQIFDASGIGGLGIEGTSKAARALLYDVDGNPLVIKRNDAVSTARGGLLSMGVNDGSAKALRVDRLGSMMPGSLNILIADQYEPASVNSVRYLQTLSSGTATQGPTIGCLLTGTLANSQGAMLQTARKFQRVMKSPLMMKARAKLSAVNNSVIEIGFADPPSMTGASAYGAYFQLTTDGVLQPVVTYNGVDRTGAPIAFSTSSYYVFDIIVDDDSVVFSVQDSNTGLSISNQTITLPLSTPRFWMGTNSVGYTARVYNIGVPASAPTLNVTDLVIGQLDLANPQPFNHALAGMERGVNCSHAGTQLAAWTNSTEPISAALSNTIAGYTTLGGKFQFAAVAGAVTDYALFGYAVPAYGNLYITAIDIESWVTGAAIATTPTLLTWGVATGGTAMNLAGSLAMRMGLGAQSFPVGAAVGTMANKQISKIFSTPLFCSSARYLHIILRIPVATATASQVIAGMVNIEGYFA